MYNSVNRLNKSLTTQLYIIDIEEANNIEEAQKLVHRKINALSQITTFISNYSFQSKKVLSLFSKKHSLTLANKYTIYRQSILKSVHKGFSLSKTSLLGALTNDFILQ